MSNIIIATKFALFYLLQAKLALFRLNIISPTQWTVSTQDYTITSIEGLDSIIPPSITPITQYFQ